MDLNNLTLKYEEQVSFQLRQLYRQYGYIQFCMSKFEEYEFYAQYKNFLMSKNILSFTDVDGKLLALKPDITLSIVKNCKCSNSLEKVYYNETVYRTASGSNGFREIMQTGLECIGDLDLNTIAEVIELAARSLLLVHGNYILDISDLDILSEVLNYSGLSGNSQILTSIKEKNIPEIKRLCSQKDIRKDTVQLICQLISLYGTPEQVLPLLEQMIISHSMKVSIKKLRHICGMLEPFRSSLRLDFSIVDDMNYYNGIIFRGYLPGIPTVVLSGGQYDQLIKHMGKSNQAIGFAVYIDQLEHFCTEEKPYDCDVLLLYDKETSPDQINAEAASMRRDGLSVRIDRCVPSGLRFRSCREVK